MSINNGTLGSPTELGKYEKNDIPGAKNPDTIKCCKQYRRGVVATLVMVVGLMVLTTTGRAQAGGNPGVIPNNGPTYGKLGADWWQWVLSFPAADAPFFNTGGPVDISAHQSGHVWFLAGANSGPGGPTASCSPGPNEVALFVDSFFRGQCVVKGIGLYPHSEDIGLPNDSISSIKVGSQVKALLCQQADFRGTCQLFTSSVAQLSKEMIGHDNVSSVKVQPRSERPECVPGDTQIAVYVDSVFRGQCKVLNVGAYPHASDTGLPNDSISSILIGSSVKVGLYEDSNFQGKFELLRDSDPNLSNNPMGHDIVSSICVRLLLDPSCPTPTVREVTGRIETALRINLGQELPSNTTCRGRLRWTFTPLRLTGSTGIDVAFNRDQDYTVQLSLAATDGGGNWVCDIWHAGVGLKPGLWRVGVEDRLWNTTCDVDLWTYSAARFSQRTTGCRLDGFFPGFSRAMFLQQLDAGGTVPLNRKTLEGIKTRGKTKPGATIRKAKK